MTSKPLNPKWHHWQKFSSTPQGIIIGNDQTLLPLIVSSDHLKPLPCLHATRGEIAHHQEAAH